MLNRESLGKLGRFFGREKRFGWIVLHLASMDEEAKEDFEVNNEDALRGCRESALASMSEELCQVFRMNLRRVGQSLLLGP